MTNQGNAPMPGATDRTVMIPTPGAARKPGVAKPALAPGVSAGDRIDVSQGLNPLVSAATTLLSLATRLASTMQHDNVPDLHRRVTEEIKRFESRVRNAGVSADSAVAARYLLCSVVDEVVLNTPWGAGSGWSQHSLLSIFHQETSGGEKCFVILNKLQEAPASHLDLLELFYLCISLGFQGKYRVIPRGYEQLEQVRDNLYQIIENQRPEWERDLSPHWEGSVKPGQRMKNYVPLWVFASIVTAALLLTYSGFRVWLYQETTPVAELVEKALTDGRVEISPSSPVVPDIQPEKRFY